MLALSWTGNDKESVFFVFFSRSKLPAFPAFLCFSTQWKRANFFLTHSIARYLISYCRYFIHRKISKYASGIIFATLSPVWAAIYVSGTTPGSLERSLQPLVVENPAHGLSRLAQRIVWNSCSEHCYLLLFRIHLLLFRSVWRPIACPVRLISKRFLG